jgi:hypothetical protein
MDLSQIAQSIPSLEYEMENIEIGVQFLAEAASTQDLRTPGPLSCQRGKGDFDIANTVNPR